MENNRRAMPLRRKLLLSMIVPALLIFLVGVVGIMSLHHLKQVAGRILSHNYHSIEEAREMEQTLRLIESAIFETRPGEVPVSDSLVAGFERSLERCEKNITEEGESEVLRHIRTAWERFLTQLSVGNTSNPTVQELQTANRIANSLYDRIDHLVRINESAMFLYEEQTRRTADWTLGGVAAALILAVGALASFSLVLARRISGPIVEVSARLHEALNPDSLEMRSGGTPVDEIVLLKDELGKLLNRLDRYENEQRARLLHMQSRLAFVINEVLEGLVLIDGERNIVTANRVARHILGLGDGNVRLEEIRPRGDVYEMLKPVLDGTFQPERDLGELKLVVGGSERVYRPRVLTVSSNVEDVEGYLLLFWDITEQRRFEESRGKLISMLSHQLKTPMTSLSMSVNMLKEKINAADESQSELLSIASEDCNSLAGLISDLIEAAREPSPGLSLRFRRIDIVKLLRAGLRPLVPQANERGIRLSIPEERCLEAWVDPVKFPWVITNIAGNALRYTPEGGTVTIAVLSEGNCLVINVSDTGIGIDAEDPAHVFEPYLTLDAEPQRGTHGLGLAIAKEIVEAHRGDIEVDSRPGEGTRFRIRIPFDARETT